MPKTQYFTAASIDGFIADADNSLDWLFQAEAGANAASASGELFRDFYAEVGALTMGATTYEWILSHEKLLDKPESWPYNGRRCWVFSHRQLPAVVGADITFASGDVRAAHQEMSAAAGGRNIWLVGGGDLVGQFADHGLLDEMIISIAPATLGSGAPLLPRRLMPHELTLTRCADDGTFVHLSYAVSGVARPPAVASRSPSE
jgi:dihydrofolate reductase